MKYIYLFLIIIIVNVQTASAGWKKVYGHQASSVYQQWGFDCADSLNCFSAGDHGSLATYFVKSTDGGNSWTIVYVDSMTTKYDENGKPIGKNPLPLGAIRSLCMPTPSMIVGGHDGGRISVSRDRGATFKSIKTYLIGDIHHINFADSLFGAAGSGLGVVVTTDAGETWENVTKNFSSIVQYPLLHTVRLIDGVIYVGGETEISSENIGFVVKSTDKGKTWSEVKNIPLKKSMWYMDINFASQNEGWLLARKIVKQNPITANIVIMHTTNAGESWTVQLDSGRASAKLAANELSFANQREGIAYGYEGEIWITNDGGDHWKLNDTCFPEFTDDFLYKIIFLKNDFSRILFAKMNKDIYLYDENLSFAEQKVSNLNVSPNPASDFISLTGFAPGERIEIYSQLGVKFLETNADEEKLDISALPTGVYFLKAGGRVGKFVKMQ